MSDRCTADSACLNKIWLYFLYRPAQRPPSKLFRPFALAQARACFVGWGARQAVRERAFQQESIALRPGEERSRASAWMIRDLIGALRQVVFLARVTLGKRKWVILRQRRTGSHRTFSRTELQRLCNDFIYDGTHLILPVHQAR